VEQPKKNSFGSFPLAFQERMVDLVFFS